MLPACVLGVYAFKKRYCWIVGRVIFTTIQGHLSRPHSWTCAEYAEEKLVDLHCCLYKFIHAELHLNMRRRPMLSSCSSDREWRRIWWPWQEKWRSSGQSSLTQKSDSVWIHQQASWVGPQIEASNEVTFTGMYCLHCLFSTPSDISRRLSILVYSPFEFFLSILVNSSQPIQWDICCSWSGLQHHPTTGVYW